MGLGMSIPTLRRRLPASWRDFFALTKPRVMTLVIFTGLCGLLAAPVRINPVVGFVAILCIAWAPGRRRAQPVVGSRHRRGDEADPQPPLALGRMERESARDFGVMLAAASVMVMGLGVSWLCAAILAGSIFYYSVIYTIWLKPRTPQNIVIGGGAGAFPPMIGWVAATGHIS
jgi:protoheme IX farnesyltransferase